MLETKNFERRRNMAGLTDASHPYLRLTTPRHFVATTQGRMPTRKTGKKATARARQTARAATAAMAARGTSTRARGNSRM